MNRGVRTEINKACYTMAIIDGKHGEMTLYGDIVAARPINFWTGEEIPGDFIVQGEFLEDLKVLQDCEDLTIHLNSCGGDAFVAIAIHNRLKEMNARKTCIVDGAAMSGGSLIMCACDKVKVHPSSIVMIHDCWSVAYDRFNSTKLRKLADDLDVINQSQAEIYAKKTGMEMDKIRDMMKRETMVTGKKAAEIGLADEVIDGDADVSVSTDHKTMYACGRRLLVAALGKLPEGIREVETEPDAAANAARNGGDNTPDDSGKNGGTNPMTLDEFRQENPEAAAALLAEAQASVNTDEAVQAAVTAERQRISEIDAVASLFPDEVVNAAKYGNNACTAQEMTYRAAMQSIKQGTAFAAAAQKDAQESGTNDLEATPAPVDETDRPLTNAEKYAAGLAAAQKLAKN